jgi:hypothetical protein
MSEPVTDAIVRAAEMLERMQAEASKRVLSAFRFEGNTVRGSVIEMGDAAILDTRKVFVRFALNDREIETSFEVDPNLGKYDMGMAFKKLMDNVSAEVAVIVCTQAAEEFSRDSVKAHEFKRGMR